MRAVIVFNILLGLIFFGIVLFQFLLAKSLKKSLYNYRNSAFIAGIIFGFVIMVCLYDYLITCLIQANGMRIYYIFENFIDVPRKFAKVALPFFIIVCTAIIISNIALMIHEGRRLKNILGVFLGIVFVGGTLINERIERIIEENILYEGSPFDHPILWATHTYLQLFILLVICYFEVYFIATVIISYLAAKQVPTYDKDFIIILGCAIKKDGKLTPLLKGRTDRAIRYAWEQEVAAKKPIKFVPSGGRGLDEVTSEGHAMEEYLLEHGAERNEVFAETKSKNTYENFLYSRNIIEDLDPNARICFSTTNYHVYRSGLIAKRMGMEVEAISSRTKWYFWPNGFVREFIAILKMEMKFHLISLSVLAGICIALGLIAYNVFKMYG